MRKYNVGDEVLLKSVVINEMDEDGDYRVEVYDSDTIYVSPKSIVGRRTDYHRSSKYIVGDVLKREHQCCIISKVMDDGCILTFPDGSGSFYPYETLDGQFKHHGISLEYELEQLLSKLKDDVA